MCLGTPSNGFWAGIMADIGGEQVMDEGVQKVIRRGVKG